MYERGHRSRYRRRHMEGDIVGDGAEDGSWRKALCAGEVLQPMGDPHWSRDTPKGLQPVEDLGWRRGNKQKGRSRERKQEEIRSSSKKASRTSPVS